MKKFLLIFVALLVSGHAVLAAACSNSISPMNFLDYVNSNTVFSLKDNPLMVSNVIWGAQSPVYASPATNEVRWWQSDGSFGSTGDVCYTKNIDGTITTGFVVHVKSDSLSSGDMIRYDGTDWVAESGYSALPTRAMWFWADTTVVTGNAIAIALSASQVHNSYWYQNTAALNDSVTYSAILDAGTYTMTTIGVTAWNRAQIDWFVDGIHVVTNQEWYSAGIVYNVIRTATVVIPTSGYHIFQSRIDSKHGSSTDYYMNLTRIWLKQVSD